MPFLDGSTSSGWHTSEAEISTGYKAFSNETIHGRMGVYIGLTGVNVTLLAKHHNNKSEDFNFNERCEILGLNVNKSNLFPRYSKPGR